MGKKRDAKKARRRAKAQNTHPLPEPQGRKILPVVTVTPRTPADQDRIAGKGRMKISEADMRSLFDIRPPSSWMRDVIMGEGRTIFGIDPAGPSGTKATQIIGDGIDDPPRPQLPDSIRSLLDVPKPKKRSGLIPPHARSVRYEDCHEWLPGTSRPMRTSFGLQMADPPIAFVCPCCDTRRQPLGRSSGSIFDEAFGRASSGNACPYCGMTFVLHGTRVVWWRD